MLDDDPVATLTRHGWDADVARAAVDAWTLPLGTEGRRIRRDEIARRVRLRERAAHVAANLEEYTG